MCGKLPHITLFSDYRIIIKSQKTNYDRCYDFISAIICISIVRSITRLIEMNIDSFL